MRHEKQPVQDPSAMNFLDEKQGTHPYETTDANRPHVFVFTLDMVPPEFHRAGHACGDAMKLPALQALRQDSVSFANAFSVSPLCGPSRASMFTGRYPYIFVNEERAHDGTAVALRPDDPIYPDYLKAVGYLCGHVGKSHIGTDAFLRAFGESCSPWNRWAPPVYDDPEYHAYLRRLGVGPFRFVREIHGAKADGSSSGNSYGGWIEQSDGTPFPIEATYPHYLVQRSLDQLNSLQRQSAPRQPLYLQVDLFAPHQPFFIPAGMEDREAELRNTLSLPASYTQWRERVFAGQDPEPRIYALYRRNWGLYDPDTAMDYLIANVLQMEVVDRALQRFLQALREKGLYDNSVIIFAADHGEMNLHGGLVDKGVYGHPKAARIPLLLKMPANVQAGRCIDNDVCLLDLAPTLLEMAGVQPCARYDGVSLLRYLDDEDEPRETPFVFEAGWHIAPNPAVAIHGRFEQGHFRYVYNAASDIDELYDLDDEEARNRINDPTLEDLQLTLKRQLADLFNADPRWRCYRQCFELEYAEQLPKTAGDNQMFIPE